MPTQNPLDFRTPDHDIHEIFPRRWSPRAMSGEPLDTALLHRVFEAARWAPSTYNVQEWRFLYAHRDTDDWSMFFDLLAETNQQWADKSGALVVVTSLTTMGEDSSPNPVHAFDAGLATQNLLLQASILDLVAHPMAGFDREAARQTLRLPDNCESHAMIALGHHGDPSKLSEENQRKESRPSARKPLSEIVREGTFDFGD